MFSFVLIKAIGEYWKILLSKLEISLESTEYQINQDTSPRFQFEIFSPVMENQWPPGHVVSVIMFQEQ